MQVLFRVASQYVLVPIVAQILKWFGAWLAREARLRSLEAENKQLKEKQEKAETPKEREDAADNIIDRFNNTK